MRFGAGVAVGVARLVIAAPARAQPSTFEACVQGSYTVRIDLHIPPTTRSRPVPVVLALFGGGYSDGSRTKCCTVPEYVKYRDALLTRGIAVAAADMRLISEAPLPAMVQDARCAGRYVRANAMRLGIDSSRIGAPGIRSGGQVALLLAFAGDVRAWDSGGFSTYPSGVHVAVSVGSPIDFRLPVVRDHLHRDITRVAGADIATNWWLGLFGSAEPSRNALTAFSPTTYLRAASPPILFFQARSDEWNHPESANALLRAMTSTGAPGSIQLVRGTHEEMPTNEAVINQAAAFLAGILTPQ